MKELIRMQLLTLLAINLALHDAVPNKTSDTTLTTGNDLSVEMKTFYSDYLIDIAKPKLVHDQFAQKHPIPKNGGKTIEFRVKHPFEKALTPLTEGVTPTPKKLDWTKLDATIQQYGDYVLLTDVLMATAIDNNLVYATELLGDQAGRTLDTITREVLAGGDSVQYADGQVAARHLLVGGDATAANNHYLTVESIRRAARFLKTMSANPINGQDYVAIIHPDVAYDLTKDSNWVNVKTYSDPEGIYTGEIGKLFNVRFIETTEAKIFHAEDLVATGGANDARTLTVASYNAKVITIDEALATADATALAGREIIVDGYHYTVVSAAAGAAGAATITIEETPTHNPAHEDVVYPGEAGAAGRDVYATIVLGADAYGTTEVEGLGMQNIVKPLGSAGTADALNQRASSGWKATKVAKRLVEAFMLRIETTSTWQSGSN